MKLSIIITLFNRKKLALRALKSCISLNLPKENYEIIIVDDGSTDNPLSLLSCFIDNLFIKYFYQENQGPAAAKNSGAKHATGDYIIFLDSDDYFFTPNCFEEVLPLLNKHPDLIYSEKIIIFKDNEYKEIVTPFNSENIFDYIIKYPLNYPGKPSYLFNKQSFLKIGGFKVEHSWGDALLFWRLYLTESSKVFKLNKTNYVYDQSSNDGVSRSRDSGYFSRVFNTINDTYKIMEKNLIDKDYAQNWIMILFYLSFRSKNYKESLYFFTKLMTNPLKTIYSLIYILKKRQNRG